MLHDLHTDANVRTAPVTQAQLDEMAADHADGIRCELSIDPAELEHLAESVGGYVLCPRCSRDHVCCTLKRDPDDRTRLVCAGGCDGHGHHCGEAA